jgi:hypothetical protein
MTDAEQIKLLREELNHFIALAQAQSQQLKRYAELQRRSHIMIQRLKDQLKMTSD